MEFNHHEMFEALVLTEKVKVRYKRSSPFMKAIGAALFWNKAFMDNVITTIGDTVYFPSEEWVSADYSRAWKILCHELVHVEDYRLLPGWRKPLFFLSYLFPQFLALGAVLSLVLWSWWPLLFLAFLAPVPAPWRKSIEVRGYAMDLAVHYWYHGSGIPQNLKDMLAGFVSGPVYYWAWPKVSVLKELGIWSRRILCNEMEEAGDVFHRVKTLIQHHKQ